MYTSIMEDRDLPRWGLRHLRYFLTVCQEGSFRAASLKLHVAQSAVSRRVQELEGALSVQLLERGPKGVTPTEAGKVLQAQAVKIEAVMAAARAGLKEQRATPPVLRLAFPRETSQFRFLPDLLAQFRARYPAIKLVLVSLADMTPESSVPETVDVMFYVGGPPSAPFSGKLLRQYTYKAALPAHHALAAEREITLPQLLAEDLILFTRAANVAAYDALLNEASAGGHSLRIVHETASEESRLALVAAGMGVTLVSDASSADARGGAIVYRPLKGVSLEAPLYAAWRKGPAQKNAQSLVALAEQVLASLAAPLPGGTFR